jgi:hypothetical protein
MSIRGLLRSARSVLLPEGEAVRRVPFGIGAGIRTRIDFAWDSAFYFGLYERELDPWIRKLVRPGTRAFDVGGYRGWTALVFARLSGAPVLVFEPNPANADLIERNAAVSGMDVRVVRSLVGAREGDGWTTLDRAAEGHFPPGFIKMDIEGAEVDALSGARRVLRELRPALIIEVHGVDKERGTLEILRDAGYEPRIVDQRRALLKEERAEGHNRWVVCEAGA